MRTAALSTRHQMSIPGIYLEWGLPQVGNYCPQKEVSNFTWLKQRICLILPVTVHPFQFIPSCGIFTLHGNGSGTGTGTKQKVQCHVEMFTLVRDRDHCFLFWQSHSLYQSRCAMLKHPVHSLAPLPYMVMLRDFLRESSGFPLNLEKCRVHLKNMEISCNFEKN